MITKDGKNYYQIFLKNFKKNYSFMKHLKTFEKFRIILEDKNYEETSWTDEINGKEITITIQEVQNYLDSVNAPTIEIPVSEVFNMCCHKGKTDKETIERSQRSNLDYPIIIAKNSSGKWTMILDGHHRLFKAHNNGIEKIKARVLELDEAPIEYQVMFR